ncbi:MAG TPA: cytochrome D1 domain-containing protein [Azoarcus taiwanensis]|uniref:Protein nirF n=1 Tax=Azoarcus taiwanensis TaxID=666964 RepID=A0A972F8D9_9RHOO|nr:cytochrome D1 domain-containing protein [Azoarcus taiwanensis]NMG03958.1 protein nirF [Azoarcus taiwanensis]HRQ57033.1 cytochrome D1 domain-containing protein [Azoarcus taiwanensis]
MIGYCQRKLLRIAGVASAALLLAACATTEAPVVRGTGDLGVIIERATGQVTVVESTGRTALAEVPGLGDLSHASLVYSRDARYAYVFGRDGGLTKVDILAGEIVGRVIQAGNAIGGAISQDGRFVVAQNYEPGGIRVFDAETLELLSEVPTVWGDHGQRAKVVGLRDLPGNRFIYSLFEAGEIWLTDLSDPTNPQTQRFPAGRQPYDALITPDGRYYIAGLFGEDGMSMLDLWQPELGVRTILPGYGRGEEPLPVFKMPHLRGWAIAGGKAYLPAIGRHEVLVVELGSWEEVGRIPVRSQPVFVMSRPDGREVWVNFAFPDNGWMQVIDTLENEVVHSFQPGRAVLHMEFTPKGEEIWISARDDDKVVMYDTRTRERIGELPVVSPSGIFFTHRAHRVGF